MISRKNIFGCCNISQLNICRWIKTRMDIFGVLIVLGASIFAVIAADDLHPSIIALSLTSSLQITQLLNYLVKISCDFESNLVAIDRVVTLINIPQVPAPIRFQIQ